MKKSLDTDGKKFHKYKKKKAQKKTTTFADRQCVSFKLVNE